MRESGVVKRMEEEEIVMDLNQWLSESSSHGEEEEEEEESREGGVGCELGDPEKWD